MSEAMEQADRPRLLDRVRHAARLRHYSLRTEETYVAWIRRFILFHNKRHPSAMGADEVHAFLTQLAVEGNVAAAMQNQALSAILFLHVHMKHDTPPAHRHPSRAFTASCQDQLATKDGGIGGRKFVLVGDCVRSMMNKLGGRHRKLMLQVKSAVFTIFLIAVPFAADAQPALRSAAISVLNTSTGSIQLQLTWLSNGACGPLIAHDPPVITISGHNIEIASANSFFDCPPPPLPIAPMPASIVADVGPLPDGTYSVLWLFPTSFAHAALAPVTGEFTVVHGIASSASAPAIGLYVGVALALTLAAFGYCSIPRL